MFRKFHSIEIFYNKNGHTQVTHSNCTDNSLGNLVSMQRRCCGMEKSRKRLDLIGFIWIKK